MRVQVLMIALFLIAPVAFVAAEETAIAERSIHIVSHGWHLGLVLSLDRDLIDELPALSEFRGYDAVEIGWGDRGFYRSESIGFGTAIAAMAWPTPSVFHVVGFFDAPEDEFPESDVLRLDLTEEGYQSLVAELRAEFASNESLGVGRYGPSLFFAAKSSYYFPKTCNVWTLARLRSAGVPTKPLLGLRANAALKQLERHGTKLRWQPKGTKLPFAMAALIGAAWAVRRRRRLREESSTPRAERQLRRAWWSAGGWSIAVFLTTVISANQEIWAEWIAKGALCGLTATFAACAVIAIDRLRSRPSLEEEKREDVATPPRARVRTASSPARSARSGPPLPIIGAE